MRQFFGKYRGKVVANKDPMHLGRIQVQVPAIFGAGHQSWALPCVPYAGSDVGFFAIPPVGANIWVEFEGGDPDNPIWSGCFWGQDELPHRVRVDDPTRVQVFKSEGMTCVLDRSEGTPGFTIQVEQPIVRGVLKLVFNTSVLIRK
ncbi:baseplate assembly protein [Oscillatoria sp. FACHB-1407]|uniref:phage baseplate assembly protein V n=1 Tax=Oscillatoria sp. FACHB-1407 TaxID=2692847 RepID=UPI001687AC35|nr:phage baseplate assembly protein V [Oscillatoria sp. FACHB-1407]MBD2463787.1 baseplate assembly protein [Oscillatoria sp. FACHB-1407]